MADCCQPFIEWPPTSETVINLVQATMTGWGNRAHVDNAAHAETTAVWESLYAVVVNLHGHLRCCLGLGILDYRFGRFTGAAGAGHCH